MPLNPIAIFYHCLFQIDNKLLDSSFEIVDEQMKHMKSSGLTDAAQEIIIGVNGGEESRLFAESLFPEKAKVIYHGLECRNECRTIVELSKWAPDHIGWHILYLHSKGATHAPGSSYGESVSRPWRLGMMSDLVGEWKTCTADLAAGFDISCSHWMWNMADGTQHIPAGNFLWITSDFASKLPSIFLRDRIKVSGINSVESRYESEVYWGNGPRPKVKQFRPNGGGGVP